LDVLRTPLSLALCLRKVNWSIMKSAVYFIFTLLSGGLFLPYWLASMSSEINRLDPNLFPNCQKTMKRLPIYYCAILLFIVVIVSLPMYDPYWTLKLTFILIWGVLFFSLYFWSIFKIANKLRSLNVKLPYNIFLLLLAFYYIPPLIFQIKLNELSATET